MPSTHSQLLLHFVFSTKLRNPLITADLQPRLYDYIGGIVRGEGGVLYAIGGMPDHLHLLLRWRTDATIASLMSKLKGGSSAWVHATFPDRADFRWQEGYGVFSVSRSMEPTVKNYIEHQPEHHAARDYKAEYIQLLESHGVDYDERYLWD